LIAFENGNQGDLFVNKSPAASINNLARAICEIYSPNHEIKIIGTRHGEKLFETLCTREEMMKSIDMGNFFRIPSDNRDLNYNRFFLEGESKMSLIDDYNSSNTDQLSIDEIKSLIKSVVN
jgi:UDP-glucose 4-epimerase